jgi:hypothetical protein
MTNNIRAELKTLAKPIGDFRTHERNVRQGDIGAICTSLEAHGQYRPIVVHRETKQILAGNHTFLAAQSLGWDKIAVTFVDCDEQQALRILVADNRANDLATYDDSALSEVLKELANGDGLAGTLYDGDDLDDLLFRLAGTLGTGHATLSAGDKLEDYEGRDTKTLALPYSSSDYNEITEQLAVLRERTGIDTNAELIKSLVGKAYARD